MTILPTHTCFDDATEILMERLNEDPRFWRLRLVHGIVQPPGHIRPHSHARVEEWTAEDGVMVWQAGWVENRLITYAILLRGPEGFEAGMNISKVTRYTPWQAMQLEKLHGPGPWEPEYIALCRDVQKPKTTANVHHN